MAAPPSGRLPAYDIIGRMKPSTTEIMRPGKSNIILTGMPGAGKSTTGIILAKLTSLAFIDTDVLIQTSQGRSLQKIVDSGGHIALRNIEEQVLLSLRCQNHVIATGGSAVYSEAAMKHLASDGVIVFIHADLQVLESRVSNFSSRGLAKTPGQSFADLYRERLPLYEKYAEITIDSSGLSQEEICAMIIEKLRQ
jgi:shikimate kinase